MGRRDRHAGAAGKRRRPNADLTDEPMPFAHFLARLGRAFFTVLMLSSLIAPRVHADAGDFQAMPGLWKIVTHTADPAGRETVAWRCVDEEADPWLAFAALMPPAGTSCERMHAHRSRTSLTWDLRCAAPAVLHGRIAFDSPEHYEGALVADHGGPLLQVEGRRYAACTSPND